MEGHPGFHQRGWSRQGQSGGHKLILIKMCYQKQGDCDKHTMPHRFHVSIKLFIGLWSRHRQSDSINSCTDACTHSNQGV